MNNHSSAPRRADQVGRLARVDNSRDDAARPGEPSYVLNFFPGTFTSQTASVWVGRWTDPDSTKALEDKIPGIRTWRDLTDGTRLIAWHPTRHLTAIPDCRKVTFTIEELPQLFERLVDDAVTARFSALGFTQKSHGFVNYQRSLLAEIPALQATTSAPIGLFSKILTDVFFTRDVEETLVFGLTMDVVYTTRMDVPAAEWAMAGLTDKLPGTYVTLLSDAPESRQYPHLSGRVVGRVSGLRGDVAVLTDARDSTFGELPLTSIAPEPTRRNLELYLQARYQRAYSTGAAALTKRLRELVRPRKRFELIQAAMFRRLQSDELASSGGLLILPDLRVRFASPAKTASSTFPSRKLDEPMYSFDRGGDRLAPQVDEGLRRHGPYDYELSEQSPTRILVIAPTSAQGQVKAAVNNLMNGIPAHKTLFTGMTEMYGLKNLAITFEYADIRRSSPMSGYADAVQKALRTAEGDHKLDLILAFLDGSTRKLPDSENPYYQIKGLALALEGVPTQMVTLEKIGAPPRELQLILSTIALACYAKLGRTSHVLRIPRDIHGPTELVFGVGRAITREERFDQATETIGFATVFRANGEYLYNDCTPYCDGSAYERALEETIKRSVERIAKFESLPDGAPLRLVFHIPRRTGRREVTPILNAINKLPRYKIDFALLHVNDDHLFHLFDPANPRPMTTSGRARPDAAFLPPRGISVALGPRERLVTFIGTDRYRGYGSPTPLRITLDRSSTFLDIDYLVQQLYLLSFMSVASFTYGATPVTLGYAERLAELTGHLRGVQQWAVELIHRKLGRKLWFV